MTEERKSSLHPFSLALLSVYNKLLKSGEVCFAAHDHQIEKLDTIVNTVEGTVYGVEKFPSPESKVSAYFCFIIKDHPMTDGNKRLAVLWLQIMCDILGLEITGVHLDILAVTVATFELSTYELSMNEFVEIVRKRIFRKKNESG